ncbi:MAG: hypothetical protein AB7H70_12170 [Rhodospirillaceae bacterium]
MSIFRFSRCVSAFALVAAASIGAQAAELPCGHPDSAPTASAKIKIENWKEPRLVQAFKQFGQQGDYVYFDGPLYVPVAGKPEQPKIFKSWQLQKSFESPAQFFILDVSNSPGDGVYTLRMYRCATAQAWEPVWKSLMDVVDTQVGVERVP